MSAPLVVEGAIIKCAVGTAPMALVVTSQELLMVGGKLVATIADCVPVDNIPPFATCDTLTAAAEGVPTPCVPAPAGPWAPGSVQQTINGLPVLTMTCKLECSIGGIIEINDPGQAIEETD